MYYVLIRTKEGKWGKTMYGARRSDSPPYGFGDVTSENFKGIPFKFEADQALRAPTEITLKKPIDWFIPRRNSNGQRTGYEASTPTAGTASR